MSTNISINKGNTTGAKPDSSQATPSTRNNKKDEYAGIIFPNSKEMDTNFNKSVENLKASLILEKSKRYADIVAKYIQDLRGSNNFNGKQVGEELATGIIYQHLTDSLDVAPLLDWAEKQGVNVTKARENASFGIRIADLMQETSFKAKRYAEAVVEIALSDITSGSFDADGKGEMFGQGLFNKGFANSPDAYALTRVAQELGINIRSAKNIAQDGIRKGVALANAIESASSENAKNMIRTLATIEPKHIAKDNIIKNFKHKNISPKDQETIRQFVHKQLGIELPIERTGGTTRSTGR